MSMPVQLFQLFAGIAGELPGKAEAESKPDLSPEAFAVLLAALLPRAGQQPLREEVPAPAAILPAMRAQFIPHALGTAVLNVVPPGVPAGTAAGEGAEAGLFKAGETEEVTLPVAMPEPAFPVLPDELPRVRGIRGEDVPLDMTQGVIKEAKESGAKELGAAQDIPAGQAQPAGETAVGRQIVDRPELTVWSRRLGTGEPDLRESPPLQQEKFALPARAALETPAAQYGRVNVARASVVEQVLEKMVFSREISGEAKVFIRLKPAVLGEVEISLRMEDGRLTGRILTDSVSVKEALEAALVQLRQRLEAQQIQVAELTVGVGRENPFDRGHRMPAAPWRERYGGHRNQGREVLEEPVLPVILPGLVNALA